MASRAPKFAPKNRISVELLAHLVSQKVDGVLMWREIPQTVCEAEPLLRQWNSRRAGKIAFRKTDRSGYFFGIIFGRTYQAHRVLWALNHGRWPSEQLDHINGNKKDNSLSNLRDVSQTENSRNQKLYKTNTSGVTGVAWNKEKGKWRSYIYLDGTQKHLGSFKSRVDALAARKNAEFQYGFHPNHGRQP